MGQHLSDMQQELQYQRYLNVAQWLGFTTPQQAYAWRQNEYQQRLLMNRAEFAGYATADQYISFLQKQVAGNRDLNTVMLQRAALYKAETDAALSYTNALGGTHASIGQLGEGLIPGAQQFQAALAGLPSQVTTELNIDDSEAISALAGYEALLRGVPRTISTHEVLTAATVMGGVPAPAALPQQSEVIPVSFGGPYQEQFAAILAEVARLDALKAEIPVDFNIDPTEVAALKAKLGQLGVTELVTAHLVSQGGGAGGGGGPPPVTPGAASADEPPADAAAKWAALGAAEKEAGNDAAGAAAEQAALSGAVTLFTGTLAKGLISMRGWLTSISLFGGLLGAVGVIHLVIDAIIELIAITVLAAVGIAAIAAALGIFILVANQAQDTLGRISDRLKATYTAASATGQAIYPLAAAFDNLASKIRPEVWQLYGDALNLVSGKAGLLGKVAVATGNYLDGLAAKVVVFITSPGFQQGLTTLVKSGIGVLQQLGDILRNLGSALLEFAKVAQTTHVAEDLLAIINAGAKLLDLVLKLPTPLLAAVVGLHAFYLWGGLLATGLISLLSPLRGLAVALGGVSASSTALATLPADASGLEKLKATVMDVGAGFGALPGRIAGTSMSLKAVSASSGVVESDLTKLKAAAAASGTAIEDLVPAGMAAKVASLSGNLDQAGKDSLNLAAAAGASGAGLESLAADAEVTAGKSGLLAGVFASLGPALASPVTWILAAVAALAFLSVEIIRANDATQLWIKSMDAQLAKTSLYTVIGQTVSDLAAATEKLNTAQKTGVGNVSELSAAQSDLSGKLGEELVHVGQVSSAYGTNMVGALNLLQVAGVKTDALFTTNNKTWAAAMVQVAGLVQGYRAMGQGLTQLQGDVSVQLVMNADQLASMAKLNTAWDSWLKLVESGPTAFVAYIQGIQTVTTNMAAAGASFAGTNAASLTLRASWASLIPQAGAVLDAVRSYSAVLQNGAQGTALLNRATKDVIASSGQMGTTNQQVRNSLIAVAEEANPAINTWQKLTQWIGPLGAAKATSDLDKVMTLLQTPVSNLAADAAKLTTALQSDLNPAMAQAEFTALGGQQAFNAFAADLQKFGPNSQTTITAGKTVAEMLLSIDKNSGTARTQFLAWGESMGLTAGQAGTLWTEVSKGAKPLADVQAGLAGSATAGQNLAASGFWGQVKDKVVAIGDQVKAHPITDLFAGLFNMVPGVTAAMDKVGSVVTAFFLHTVPDAAKTVGSALAGAWTTAFQNFMRGFGSPITSWFTTSFPHAMSVAWNAAWSALVTPVVHAFDAVKSAITSGFDQWWASHGKEVEQVWNGVTTFIEHNWDNVWGAVKATFGGVEDAFKTFAGGLEGAWKTLVGWFAGPGDLHKILLPMWNGLVGAFQQAVSGVEAVFKLGWAFIEMTGKTAFDALAAVFKTVWDGLMAVMKVAWAAAIAVVKIAWDVFVGVINVALDLLTGHWSKAWNDMKAAFTQVMNAIMGFWNTSWKAALAFLTQLWNNFDTFFHQLWNNAIGFLKTLWSAFWSWFSSVIIGNFSNFFTHTIPGWFSGFVNAARSAWSSAWNSFNSTVIGGMSHFFTSTIPAWWRDFISGGANAMQQVANSLDQGFKNAINWVISHVINGAIGLINKVTGIVGIPAIKGVGLVSASGGLMPGGGSIAGTGDEDGTHVIAMGGEYMLRKPARMALEHKYGRGFMDHLNQADQWLGSGSRGNFASQGRPMALGGVVGSTGYVPPLRGHAPSLHAGDPMATGGQIVAKAESYAGAPYVYGGTTPSGWDCSGFVQYVLDAEGYHPPRTSEAQYAWTQRIQQSQLLPGNLVFAQFPGDNASPGHVGFYVGNSEVLSAEDPQLGTGYSSLSSWGGNIVGYGAEPGPGLLGQIGSFLGGVGSEILSAVEGLTNAAGDALTGNVSGLAQYVSGGASALLKLAKNGIRPIFDAVWASTIQPMINKVIPGGNVSASGATLQYAAASIKKGIDTVLGAKDAAAAASSATAGAGLSASASGPGAMSPAAIAKLWDADGGNPAAADNMARIAMAESGDVPTIVQQGEPPGLTGWGLYQITPTSGITQNGRFGNLLNASNNTKAAISLYNSSGYGPWTSDPVASGLVASGLTYAAGGAVGVPPTGGDTTPSSSPASIAETNWQKYATTLPQAVTNEVNAFWGLNAAHLPSTASTEQWAQWYADLGILQQQQLGTVSGSWGSWTKIAPAVTGGKPESIKPSDWTTFASRIKTQTDWLADRPTPPSSEWHLETSVPWPKGFKTVKGQTPGHIPPSAWAAWKYQNALWGGALNKLGALATAESGASKAWNTLYGPNGSISTSPQFPGPVGGLPGGPISIGQPPGASGPTIIDLSSLIPMGPVLPVSLADVANPVDLSGMGFAGGGTVSLADVAGQFAFGGAVPMFPSYNPAGLPQGLVSSVSQANEGTPRTVTGSAGDRIGVSVGNLTINNPTPEKPSDSITRSSNRLAFLAGRGPV